MDKENPREGDKYITVQKVGKKIFEAEVEILEYDALILFHLAVK